MTKYPALKVNLTEAEKQKVEQLAAENHQSVSAYVKSLLLPLISEQNIRVRDNSTFRSEVRDKRIAVFLTESEYEDVRQASGSTPLSRFARDLILSGSHPIEITVTTDDIFELSERVSTIIDRLNNTFAAWQYRKQVHEQDVKKITDLTSQMANDIHDTCRQVYKNRESIKKSGVRWLKSVIQLKTQNENI